MPHLLLEPFRTFDEFDDVQLDGWHRMMATLDEHGQGLSVPPGVASYKEVAPADLRHKLGLQYCFGILGGLAEPRADGSYVTPLEPCDGVMIWITEEKPVP